MRSHGNGHHSPQEETLAMIAIGSSSSSGLLATVSATAAGPVTLNNVSFTSIVSAPAVVVAAGQKVIIHTSIEYDGGTGNGTAQLVTQEIQDGALVVHDTARQSVTSSSAIGGTQSAEIVARTIELSGLTPGSFVFSVLAETSSALAPIITALNASIVVELVNV